MIQSFKNRLSSHGTFKVPWLTLGLTLLFVCLYLFNGQLFQSWVFDQAAISQGEWWRWITGHLIHFNFEHLFWDLVGFVILGTVIELSRPRHLISSLLISCFCVSAWLYWGNSPYPTYCGLSGALNGMLVVAALIRMKDTENKVYLWVILLTVFKMVFEFTTHQTVFTSLASQAVPGAHAAGFAAGLLYWLTRHQSKLLISEKKKR